MEKVWYVLGTEENKGKQVFQNGLDEEFATFKTLEPSIQNIIDEAYMDEFMSSIKIEKKSLIILSNGVMLRNI